MRALLLVFAVAAVFVAACGKTSTDGTMPSQPPRCEVVGCVTANPCRKNDCSGELFWNGCCACPPGTVNAFTCDGGAPN